MYYQGAPVNEWGFGGEIKSWWDAQFAEHREWGLTRCELERSSEGSHTRADVTVFADDGRPVLVIELRLPDHPEPNPWHLANLDNAFRKAQDAGVRWSATSDGEQFLLLDSTKTGPLFTRVVHRARLSRAADRAQLDTPAVLAQIRQAWTELLVGLVPIITETAGPPLIAPDELFVESLRALLAGPVAAIRDELSIRKDTDEKFREHLIHWMVDQQGWSHSAADFEAEVARVASVAAYVFTTRLLFYEALRRAQPSISPLDLGTRDDPFIAETLVESLFEHARQVSGDYDTVFTYDNVCRYALLSRSAVEGWHRVLDHLSQFQLDAMSYDVLGRLFERFIDPAERYRWGQHYTSPDVVDLMLSLAIPDGTGTILDPAAGGGTFLVRGYVRKKVFNPEQGHEGRLRELAGCDISAFAASLATVSLASRDLSFTHNYSCVRAGSFFQRGPGQPFMELPAPDGKGLQSVTLPSLAAVVCNPPYIALRHLGDDRQQEAARALTRAAGHRSVPRQLRGVANYHLYFWFHGAQFIADEGRLVFITSGEWLDSDYGVQLQRWLLDNTCIELVVESLAETWFTEARVGTVVLSARRCTNEARRSANAVRFVTLRQPLADLYGCLPSETDTEHITHVDHLRDRLLALDGLMGETIEFDHTTVTQTDLHVLGGR